MNNNRYATPVELREVGERIWRGQVEPLEARLSLYMSIQRADDGSLTAVVRNPERNLFRRNVYHVDVSGDALTFSDTKNPSEKFQGRLEKNAIQVCLSRRGLTAIPFVSAWPSITERSHAAMSASMRNATPPSSATRLILFFGWRE